MGHDGVGNGGWGTEIEGGCLAVAVGAACSLRPIIGAFPVRVAQKLAQLGELRLVHAPQQV
jgi:hypothetical protein